LTAALHAMAVLSAEGLVIARRGRRAVVAGDPADARPARRAKSLPPGHDYARSGCIQHTCRPMSAATIRQIHAILSGVAKPVPAGTSRFVVKINGCALLGDVQISP
jgi:hypothetical protein